LEPQVGYHDAGIAAVLFLEWAADFAATHADDGVDTFVFRDGLIRVQTARYSVRDKG
jgi:hypothetical protein